MPERGVDLSPTGALLTTDEIVRLAQLFVSQGVDKIRLTGGEPTVRKDLLELVGEPSFNFWCIRLSPYALGNVLSLTSRLTIPTRTTRED